jgi:hypothetical protein
MRAAVLPAARVRSFATRTQLANICQRWGAAHHQMHVPGMGLKKPPDSAPAGHA